MAVVCVVIAFLFFGIAPVMADELFEDGDCLDCHEEMDASLRDTPHRLSSEIKGVTVQVACVSCHNGAESHLDDPDRSTIESPAELSGKDVFDLCTQCHPGHVTIDNYGFDAHSIEELNCSECHRVHGHNRDLLLDDKAEFCTKCHREKVTGFSLNSSHPINSGSITCLSCHRFTKRLDANLEYEFGGVCGSCHPDKSGPFLYEHEAVNSYSLDGAGCTECHDPHASANDFLLRQPVSQLCRQCHYPAGHFSEHGGIWADYDCQICHSDLHGSFVSNLFLDPDLITKLPGADCYNAGCHSLIR